MNRNKIMLVRYWYATLGSLLDSLLTRGSPRISSSRVFPKVAKEIRTMNRGESEGK